MVPVDRLGRPLRALRISVTDRCNLRCNYCMPEAEYVWLPRADVLTFEETSRLVDVFASLGVDKLRLTGGEPLLRRDLPRLVRLLAGKPAIREIALTTNGVLLAQQAEALAASGLTRVTVSLDTLQPARFLELTRLDRHGEVLEAIEEARRRFTGLKIDSVVMRGFNDDELQALVEFGGRVGAEVRFIEYMDVGGASRWSPEQVVSRQEILARLSVHYGRIEPISDTAWAPADRFRLADGRTFGIIASTSTPFCRTCDRSRLTADGVWYTCLYATRGLELRGPLRAGCTEEELRAGIARAWSARDDRGAELRLEHRERGVFVPVETLKDNPHLEMHTRGG